MKEPSSPGGNSQQKAGSGGHGFAGGTAGKSIFNSEFNAIQNCFGKSLKFYLELIQTTH